MKGVCEVRECTELRSAFQNYTSHFFHANNCEVLINCVGIFWEKQTRAENQKLKINLESPYVWICLGTTSIPVYMPKHTFELKIAILLCWLSRKIQHIPSQTNQN